MSAASKPLPPPLREGARIGVMAPAGPTEPLALAAGMGFLRGQGFEVVPAPNLEARSAYLAGSDEERLEGLERLLDGGADALIAARGGYGVMRILPRLPWDRLAGWQGWLVGFSDITALHAACATRFPRATLHGPMISSLGRDAEGGALLVSWLRGNAPRRIFRIPPRRVVRGGVVRGVAVGGTLSLLAALIGTAYEPDYDGAVLFLEDVGEPLYRLDRLLTQLRLSSRLARVKAMVAGRLARCGRGEPGWRERWRGLLADAVGPEAVVVEGLTFGHGGTNVPFPLGVEVSVDTAGGEITWGGA